MAAATTAAVTSVLNPLSLRFESFRYEAGHRVVTNVNGIKTH